MKRAILALPLALPMAPPLALAVPVALALLPGLASAQSDKDANFAAVVKAEATTIEFAAVAKACGLRPASWAEKLGTFTATGVQNVAMTLWPGDDQGLSQLGQQKLKDGLGTLESALHEGLSAGPDACRKLSAGNTLDALDTMAERVK